MAGLWVLGEVTADGTLARISTEVATLARTLAEASGQEVAGVVVAADPTAAATELATYLPRVLAVSEPAAADRPWSMVAAERIAGLLEPDTKEFMFVGAGPDGRDVAGALSATLGWGVLANALGATWVDGGPVVEMSVFGGKLTTTSRFTGPTGIVTVRPNVVTAAPSKAAGSVEVVQAGGGDLRQPAVRVAERVVEAGTAAPIEEAKVIVAGGRGVGGPDGFRLVEQIAEALGGAAGSRTASRSARRARSSSRSSTSPSASVARSSTRSGCRRPRRSWPSTATRMLRSPTLPTSSSSGTCSRSGRRSSPSSALGRAETGQPGWPSSSS